MSGFTFLRPASLEEALALFAQAQGAAVYLAGGTDVLVRYRKGQIRPDKVISLKGLVGLDFIEDRGEKIAIGGLATLEEVNRSPLVADGLPVLKDAVADMASVQIRNVATLAGNLANAAPSADSAPPLLALGAKVVLAGLEGRRCVNLDGFFLGPGRTAMQPGEIMTEILIPRPQAPAGGGYVKVSRRKAMDLSVLGVALQVEFEADGLTARRVGIGLGVAGPTPLRAREAENHLSGRPLTEENLIRAGRLAAAESSCRDSLRGEAWYRREMIRVHLRRLGRLARERAGGI